MKINFTKTSSGLIPSTQLDVEALNKLDNGKEFEVNIKTSESRTSAQNRSIHLFCKMLSDALNNAGLDISKTMKEDAAIPWSETLVKELIWRKVQLAMFDTDSTTKLDTKQVSEVYEVVNRHLASTHGVSVSFPDRFHGGEYG